MKIVKWIFAGLFGLCAVSALSQHQFASSFFYLLLGVLCAPPFLPWFTAKTNIRPATWQSFAVGFVIFILAAVNMKKPATRPNTLIEAKPTTTAQVDTVSTADLLRRELEYFDKPFISSDYRGELTTLQAEIVLFGAFGGRIRQGEAGDQEARKLASELRRKTTNLQEKEFPQMRADYAKAMATKLWESDIYVTAAGNRNTTLRITGGLFAANRNIKEFQENIHATVAEFRFRRVEYRWYKEADQYTFYTIETPDDGALVEL